MKYFRFQRKEHAKEFFFSSLQECSFDIYISLRFDITIVLLFVSLFSLYIMSYYYQRIATLLVFSLFILQILAAASVQGADSGKKLTLTFDELNKETAAAKPTQTPSADTDLEAAANKDKVQPQQATPQHDETDEEEYEEIEIISGDEDDMLGEEDMMDDEVLDNPPPPQEIEPFVDEEEAEPSAAADVASASASMYDEGVYEHVRSENFIHINMSYARIHLCKRPQLPSVLINKTRCSSSNRLQNSRTDCIDICRFIE